MAINLFDFVKKEKLDRMIKDLGYDGTYNPVKKINFSSIEKKTYSNAEIAAIIDHTILRADAVSEEIRTLCNEAVQYGFASVCVNPFYVPLCSEILKGSKIKVCTVIGFPLGANEKAVKKFEAEQAINNEADEIDMVINISRSKDEDHSYVYEDISEVVQSAKVSGKLTKVIIENCYLSEDEKINACILAVKAGAEFVKTSTGFGSSGATYADVALMKYVVGDKVKVKAAGGIRTREDAELMMSCGAERLGTSSGVKIMKQVSVNDS
jgi:deoxyribose-phosphate aldolase